MRRYFKFMTGANHYRLEAVSREEAIQVAIAALCPTEDVKDLIANTMYEEGAETHFHSPDGRTE